MRSLVAFLGSLAVAAAAAAQQTTADLSIKAESYSSPPRVQIGLSPFYYFTITNLGPGVARDVSLLVAPATQAKATRISPPFTCSNNQCAVGNLAVNETRTFSVSEDFDPAVMTVSTTVHVATSSVDPNPENN